MEGSNLGQSSNCQQLGSSQPRCRKEACEEASGLLALTISSDPPSAKDPDHVRNTLDATWPERRGRKR